MAIRSRSGGVWIEWHNTRVYVEDKKWHNELQARQQPSGDLCPVSLSSTADITPLYIKSRPQHATPIRDPVCTRQAPARPRPDRAWERNARRGVGVRVRVHSGDWQPTWPRGESNDSVGKGGLGVLCDPAAGLELHSRVWRVPTAHASLRFRCVVDPLHACSVQHPPRLF
jgi:hypothetical protein